MSEELAKTYYICPICGEEHKHYDFCPIVANKMNNIRFDRQSYIMGAIVLECLKQEVDFIAILKEMAGFMADLEYVEPWAGNKFFNTDFVVSYFASSMNCDAEKFYKKRSALAKEYSEIIKQSSVFDTGADIYEDGEINEIDIELESPNGTFLEHYGGFNTPSLHLVKTFSSRKSVYYLRLIVPGIEVNRITTKGVKQKKEPALPYHFKNIAFGESRALYDFDLCAEKDGALKLFFEKYYDWKKVAQQYECSEEQIREWIHKLTMATQKKLLYWNKRKNERRIFYSTTYGCSEIELQICCGVLEGWYEPSFGDGDGILVKESERKMFCYGSEDDKRFSENSKTIIEIPMLRALGGTIEKWQKKHQEKSFVTDDLQVEIKKSDVLSVTYSFICSQRNHTVLPYCGIITILTPDNQKIEERVYLGYCKDCNVYYIFKRDFNALKEKGILLCRVIDSVTGHVISDGNFQFNSQSVLAKMGYNVQASSNLSIEERKRILKKVIDERMLPVHDIINLLEMQIHLHGKNEKYEKAVSKWKEDVSFLKEYGITSGRDTHISEIKS